MNGGFNKFGGSITGHLHKPAEKGDAAPYHVPFPHGEKTRAGIDVFVAQHEIGSIVRSIGNVDANRWSWQDAFEMVFLQPR